MMRDADRWKRQRQPFRWLLYATGCALPLVWTVIGGYRPTGLIKLVPVSMGFLGLACCVKGLTIAVGNIRAARRAPFSGRRIERIPGSLIDLIARFFWSRKTYEHVFEPARADIVQEWRDAIAAGRDGQAWWIKHVRGRFTMLSHLMLQIPFSWGRKLIEIVKAVL